jgi:hypothetical protein
MRSSTPLATVLLLSAAAGCNKTAFLVDDPYEDPAADAAPADFGSWLSMAVAPDDQRLLLAGYDRENGALTFAVGTEGADGAIAWAHEQVDGYFDNSSGLDVGDRGKFASMKVAPDGTVWIAYYDATKKDLRFAHRLGGVKSWTTGLVDSGSGSAPAAGEWASLALDAQGNPVIAYHDAGTKKLKTARFAGINGDSGEYTWTIAEVQSGQPFVSEPAEDGSVVTRDGDVGKFARLLIEGGTEYIAYYDAGQQRLGLLEGTGGVFAQSFVTPAGTDMGQWPSLLVDQGSLVVAFHDVTNQDLIVGRRGAGGWSLEIADAGEYVGADTEIFTRGGTTAVVYYDGQNNDMKLAEKTGAVWSNSTIGVSDHAVGFHNEVVRVTDGFWLASYDFSSRVPFSSKLIDP